MHFQTEVYAYSAKFQQTYPLISEQGVRRLASLRCENGHVGCQNVVNTRGVQSENEAKVESGGFGSVRVNSCRLYLFLTYRRVQGRIYF